ncbi:hypothetical protein GIB67_009754, partial [Kingdonia uniflora]
DGNLSQHKHTSKRFFQVYGCVVTCQDIVEPKDSTLTFDKVWVDLMVLIELCSKHRLERYSFMAAGGVNSEEWFITEIKEANGCSSVLTKVSDFGYENVLIVGSGFEVNKFSGFVDGFVRAMDVYVQVDYYAHPEHYNPVFHERIAPFASVISK